MPSQEQVAYHYAMLTQQQREQEEAQARANAQAAALQSQRDAELSQQQLVQQRQQQQYAAQREALQAGYGQQSQVLGAGLQQQRDVLGHNIQLEQMGYGAGLQSQQNQQNSQLRQQEAEHGANLQAQLSQVQLNQQEEMRMRRLQQAASHTDEQVQGGYLTLEEAAQLKTQIMTGLNPLQNRHLQAQTLQSQIAAQAQFQETQQRAELHNQQQQWLARGLDNAIVDKVLPNGQRVQMFVNHRGEPTILDTTRQEESHQMQMAQGASGINVNESANRRADTAAPINNANTLANTTATLGANTRADTSAPLTNAQTIATTNSIINGDRRAEDLAPHALDQVLAHTNLLDRQAQEVYRQNQAAGRAESDVDKERRIRLRTLSNTLQQQEAFNARTTPRVSPDGNFVEIQPGHWAPNGSPLANQHIAESRARTALTQLQVDGGMSPQLAMSVYEHASRAVDTELTAIGSSVSQRIMALPAGERAAATEAFRSQQMTARLNAAMQALPRLTHPNRPGQAPPARPNEGANQPAPAPAPAERPLLPEEARVESTVAPARARELQTILSSHVPGNSTSRLDTELGSSNSATVRQSTLAMRRIVDQAASENRNMTVGEVQRYLQLQQAVNAENPDLGRLFSLSATPQQESYSAPVARLGVIRDEARTIYNNEASTSERAVGPATRGVGQLYELLNTAANENRALTPAETARYHRIWGFVNQHDPRYAARLVLHR